MQSARSRRRRRRRLSVEKYVSTLLREERLRAEMQVTIIALARIELRRLRNSIRNLERSRGQR